MAAAPPEGGSTCLHSRVELDVGRSVSPSGETTSLTASWGPGLGLLISALCCAGWEGPPPPRGCEVFVGKIPRDMYEDELVPLFEKAGTMYEFRLMMEFSGENRGYAFVMYTNR